MEESNKILNVNVTTGEGSTPAKVIVGADVIQLEDLSTATFTALSLDSFISAATTIARIDDKAVKIYYSRGGATLWPADSPSYNMQPLAKVSFEKHPLLTIACDLINKTREAKEFAKALRVIQPFLDTDGIDFIKLAESGKLKGVTDIEDKQDKHGNVVHAIKRATTWEELEIPETIAITVPAIVGATDKETITLKPMTSTNWREDSQGAFIIEFGLEHPTLTLEINDRIEAIVKARMEQIGAPAFFGSMEINRKTSIDLIKLNPASL